MAIGEDTNEFSSYEFLESRKGDDHREELSSCNDIDFEDIQIPPRVRELGRPQHPPIPHSLDASAKIA